jgi:hypothetical protein
MHEGVGTSGILSSVHHELSVWGDAGRRQTCFYFGYTAMFCLGLGIMCGAVGFVGSSTFVTRIYRNIKCD